MQINADLKITPVSPPQCVVELPGSKPAPCTDSTSRHADEARIELKLAHESIHQAWWTEGAYFPCLTGPSRDLSDGAAVYPESFTAMVIADLLMAQAEQAAVVENVMEMLEEEVTEDGLFHFFQEHDRLPADADCTALGLSVLLLSGADVWQSAHLALDRIVTNVGELGVVETYFGAAGRTGIIDPVVCANVLVLAHLLGREREVFSTYDYVCRVLTEGSFVAGTRYYHGPDTFLYFLGRLVHMFPATHGDLLEPLRAAIRDRHRATAHPIDVAQRLVVARWVGLDDEAGSERELLLALQRPDGTWPGDSLFRYGRRKIYFGSQALATAFALGGLCPLAAVPVPEPKPRMLPALF